MDEELQRDMARFMYIKNKDLDLEEELGIEYSNEMYTKSCR